MHTIRQGLGFLALFNMAYTLGHGAIGQKHKLFDELVGVFRAFEVASCGLAFVVDVEVEFLAVELYRPIFEAFGP